MPTDADPTDAHSTSVRAGTPNAALAALLTQIGWNPEHLARRVNQHAAAAGRRQAIHRKTPYRWRDGGVHPREPWPALVAAVLSDAAGRLITPADLGWRTQSALVGVDQGLSSTPWTQQGAVRAMELITEQWGRRRFLTHMGTAVLAAQQWQVTPPISGGVVSSTGSRVPASAMDQLDLAIAAVRRLDDQLGGGGALLDLVHAQLTYIVWLLRHRSYTDSIGQRLHGNAGELMRLAGWLAFESGDHGLAQRYWATALRAAHTAGDRALGANIVGFMSCQAKDRPGTQARQLAVTLADTAISGYPGASPRVAAILELRSAEALAGMGSDTECRRRIDNAFTRLASTPRSEGEPAWSYWMDLSQAHAQAGYCLWRLSDWSGARHHLATALHGQGPQYSREATLRQILLARTYLRQRSPDRDQALDLADRAVTALETDVDSPRCVSHLTGLVTDLMPYLRHSRPAAHVIHRVNRLASTTTSDAACSATQATPSEREAPASELRPGRPPKV